MKLQHIILAGMAIAMVATSCKESRINPGDNGYNQDTIHVAPPMPDPTAAKAILDSLPDSLVLTVQQARDTCTAMGPGGTTATEYYIKGWVCALDAKNAEAIEKYGNAVFYMGVSYLSQVKHSFEAYQVYGKDKKKIVDPEAVKVGDFVIVKSKLTNYNGTPETPGQGAGTIIYSTNERCNPIMDTTKITPDPAGVDVPAGTLSVYQALKISDELGIGNTSTETYYIKGWISKLDSKNAEGIANYGNATFYITATNDGTTNAFTFEAYQVYGKNGKRITNLNQVEVGDFVVLKSKIKNFNGVAETTDKGSASIYSSSNTNFNAEFNK